LTALPCATGRPFGESFEISADDADDEARLHPSIIPLGDGSPITLPALLAVHGDIVLGDAFVERYGRRYPLLPKLLDIAELLSVQAHPLGNTEAYVIVEADPGATIRLGFSTPLDAATWAARLEQGRRDQQRLLELFGEGALDEAQRVLKPWLEQRDATPAALEGVLRRRLEDAGSWTDVEAHLAALHEAYWTVLDSLNALPVKAGDVVYNANPARVVAASGRPRSAEVHALGNPEGRGVFALEIRKPGVTFRAWDHVRFPLRDIDVDAALEALSLAATRPEEFIVEPKRVRPGVRRSVDSEYFRVEHLELSPGARVAVPESQPHTLHALLGRVRVLRSSGDELGTLERGESALVPVRVGAYSVVAEHEAAVVVKVDLPPYVD
jgi:mannose-6-phosphate isomerase class I